MQSDRLRKRKVKLEVSSSDEDFESSDSPHSSKHKGK